MKLKAVHTYQYVRFRNKNENFISADKTDMKDVEMELLKEGVVSIKSPVDHILVFPTNIAYCIPLTEETKARKVDNRGKLLENDPSTPKK